MKTKNPLTIRPSNAANLILILLSALSFAATAAMLYSIVCNALNGQLFYFVLVLSPFGIWMGVLFLSIAIIPKIKLFNDHMEIIHWRDGLPYGPKKSKSIKFPKSKTTKIKYDEIKIYGSFLVKDVKQQIKKGSGFLSDQRIAASLGSVLLIFYSNEKIIVIDAGMYGSDQIEFLLFELEKRTHIRSIGRAEPKYHLNSYLLNTLKALAVLLFLTALPISTIWIEGIFNPHHTPAYQSVFRHIYVLSALFANLCLGIYFASRKHQEDPDIRGFHQISKIALFVLYPIFGFAFIISVVTGLH